MGVESGGRGAARGKRALSGYGGGQTWPGGLRPAVRQVATPGLAVRLLRGGQAGLAAGAATLTISQSQVTFESQVILYSSNTACIVFIVNTEFSFVFVVIKTLSSAFESVIKFILKKQ